MSAAETANQAGSLVVPNASDRILGASVHVSSIFWPLLGPLVGWLAFRKQKPYVAAHARQALLETALLSVGLFLALVASTAYTVVRISHFIQTNWADFTWQEFIFRFLAGWILLAVLELANTFFSIVQAVGALNGRWPRSTAKG